MFPLKFFGVGNALRAARPKFVLGIKVWKSANMKLTAKEGLNNDMKLTTKILMTEAILLKM